MGLRTRSGAFAATDSLKNQLGIAIGILLLGVFSGAGCNDQTTAPASGAEGNLDGSAAARRPLSTPAAKPRATGVTAPFDVGAVMRQVHFAFSADEGGGYLGGHDTYGVTVQQGDGVTVIPVHHPRDESARKQEAGLNQRHLHPSPHLGRIEPTVGAPVSFKTVAVRRQHSLMSPREIATSLAQDGSLVLDHGAVTELLRNTDEGVEQSWRLPRRPDGNGDLELRIRVSGQRYAGRTAQGLHFVDPKSGLGVRYGWATWIDNQGARAEVRGTFVNGEIRLLVPAAMLDRSAYPAVLDPLISPEFGMDNPTKGPAWGAQRLPAVASDGSDYLVVWDDFRHLKSASYDIYGVRVSAAGKVLDPVGILISGVAGHQYSPSAAFDGTRYLVAWHDHRHNSTYPDIYGARLSAAGALEDPSGIAISTATRHQYYPEIAVGGGNFMVVWQDYRNGSYSDIYGARVSTLGTVVDKAGILISAASHHQVTPTLAFDGTNFMVVWMDYRHSAGKVTRTDIYGGRVSPHGVLLDKTSLVVCKQGSHQYYPTISYLPNGSSYLVVWQDYRNYPKSYWDIYGRMVSTSGVLKGAVDIPITTAKGHQYSPVVAQSGADFLVAWQDGRNGVAYDIYGARVSSAGALVSNSQVVIASAVGAQQRPALTAGKGGYLVVWEDHRNAVGIRSDIYAARVTASGANMDPAGIMVSTATPDQVAPAVAHDGTNYLVVWQDLRNYAATGTDILGALVSPSGTLVSTSGIAISKGAKDQLQPAVAFGGGKYLVVWQDARSGWNIYGAQVDTNGKVNHPSGVAINVAPGNQLAPAVAHDGVNYLVVWEDYRKSASYPDIYGARVNKYGGVMSATGILISNASYYQRAPRVAYGVGNYLVVWQDYRTYTISGWDIYGARISTTGTLLDTSGIQIATAVNHQLYPDVAHDSANYLVVWQDYRNTSAGTAYDVYGTRISSAGNVLGSPLSGTPISISGGDQIAPKVASSNSSFLVAWEDYRGGKFNPDIFGTLVSSAGLVQSKLGVSLSATAGYDINPNITSPGAGTYMVVYSRFNSGDGAFQVKGRFVSELHKGGTVCTSAKACSSGFCVDGVCCDSACGGGAAGDCQACAVAKGTKVDGTCRPLGAGTQCRAAAGPCDTVESCDGFSVNCAADLFKGLGVVCRGSLGSCDTAEICSGFSAACPADQLLPTGTTCRAAAGACDMTEACVGTSAVCPADGFLGSSKTCWAAAGPCDTAESCSGTAAACPTDQFKTSAMVCRAAAQECDLAESCSGAAAACPADLYKLDNTSCSKGQCLGGKCSPPDMGPPDQGIPEAGPDSGPLPDTGAPDHGGQDVTVLPDKPTPSPDSKTPGAEGTVIDPGNEDGCSCSVTSDPAGEPVPGALLLLALGLLGWRRRLRAPR